MNKFKIQNEYKDNINCFNDEIRTEIEDDKIKLIISNSIYYNYNGAYLDGSITNIKLNKQQVKELIKKLQEFQEKL